MSTASRSTVCSLTRRVKSNKVGQETAAGGGGGDRRLHTGPSALDCGRQRSPVA